MTRRALRAGIVVGGMIVLTWLALTSRSPSHQPTAASVAIDRVAAAATGVSSSTRVTDAGALGSTHDGSLRLEGQVLGPDGAGVAGARVRLATVPPRFVTAELDGSFVFEHLAAGSYVITAAATRLVGGPVGVRLGAASEPVLVRMVAASALAVDVVDERGAAVADARVAVADVAAATSTTDVAGRAVLEPLRPGEVAVVVSARGFASATATTMIAAAATTTLTIVLHDGHSVSGRVVDEAGHPIAGARVAPLDGSDGIDGIARAQSTTDATGRFVLADLAAGPLVLGARDDEHAPAFSPPLVVASRDLDGITIIMRAGGVVHGRVLDVEGRPCADAAVRISGHDVRSQTTIHREQRSDPDGRFEVRGLPRLVLRAEAHGERGASRSVELDLRGRTAVSVELRLDVTGTIAGIVVAGDGAPVAEVEVSAFAEDLGEATEVSSPSRTTTDGAGGFVLRGMQEGRRYALAVTSSVPGLRNPERPTTALAGARDVRLVLSATGGLRGRVVIRGTGTPPARVFVQVGGEMPVAASGGAFEATELAPGRYDVIVSGDFASRSVAGVVVEPGRVTDLGRIDVDRGRTLVGKVVDDRGAGIPGAHVATLDGRVAVASGLHGRFTLTGLPAIATRVVAEHPARGRSEALAIDAGVADPPSVRLVLGGVGILAGQVTVAGRPQPDVMIAVVPSGADGGDDGGELSGFARTDHDGAFVVPALPAGSYVVSATQPISESSLASASATVRIESGARAQVTLDVPRDARTVVN